MPRQRPRPPTKQRCPPPPRRQAQEAAPAPPPTRDPRLRRLAGVALPPRPRRRFHLPTKRNPPPKLLLLRPTTQLTSLAGAGAGDSSSVINSKFESLDDLRPGLGDADVVVFFSPARSQLGSMREICEAFHPKPAVLFNSSWSYEEEGEMARSFVRSFEVVYSFTGMEVRGVLSRKRGVVFRCVKDGGHGAGEGWEVMMEGEGGKMELVTSFKRRPAMGEVENVLYNVMAMNSPVTKTVKFLRKLASSSSSSKDKEDEKKKKKKLPYHTIDLFAN